MFINGLLRWETSAVSAVSTQYFYDGMERLVEVVPAAAPSARTVYDDVVIGTKTHARGRVKQTLTRPLGVTGVTALGVPTVKVNGVPPSGRPPGNGEPGGFAQWLDGLAGTAGSPWAEINLEVSRNTSGSTHAASYQRSGPVFVRPSESPAYDVDGNLTQDGWGTYQWDGENRLKSAQMHEVGAPPQVALQRIELVYDAQGRRVAKRLLVKETVDAAGHFTARETSWRLVKEQRFWYDGWNLMLETQKRPNGEWRKLRSYLWGQDLSGSLQGAGGVGGLLGLTVNLGALEGETGVEQSYATLTEVNGNLMGLLDAVSGNLVARWDYDPFGNLVTDWYALGSGVSSAVCPIRFSSKYQDAETGWLYYGYRYYDAVNGRFIGRDPIEEAGGLNLYGFCGNDGVGRIDYLGLKDYVFYTDGQEKGGGNVEVTGSWLDPWNNKTNDPFNASVAARVAQNLKISATLVHSWAEIVTRLRAEKSAGEQIEIVVVVGHGVTDPETKKPRGMAIGKPVAGNLSTANKGPLSNIVKLTKSHGIVALYGCSSAATTELKVHLSAVAKEGGGHTLVWGTENDVEQTVVTSGEKVYAAEIGEVTGAYWTTGKIKGSKNERDKVPEPNKPTFDRLQTAIQPTPPGTE
jgi:RHS repeat-associated protein